MALSAVKLYNEAVSFEMNHSSNSADVENELSGGASLFFVVEYGLLFLAADFLMKHDNNSLVDHHSLAASVLEVADVV